MDSNIYTLKLNLGAKSSSKCSFAQCLTINDFGSNLLSALACSSAHSYRVLYVSPTYLPECDFDGSCLYNLSHISQTTSYTMSLALHNEFPLRSGLMHTKQSCPSHLPLEKSFRKNLDNGLPDFSVSLHWYPEILANLGSIRAKLLRSLPHLYLGLALL